MSAEAAADGEHRIEVAARAIDAQRRLAQTAESWGGRFEADGLLAGHLALPVRAGLRHGWIAGPVAVEEAGDGARLLFRIEESTYRVHRPAFLFLLLAALGALVTVFAPLVPRLWPLVPFGVLLALAGWFLVVARLANSGAEEFLADVAESLESDGYATEDKGE